MPRGAYGLTAVTVGSLIYAIGGYYTGGDIESYNPKTDMWTQLPDAPAGATGLTAVVGPDGKIYTFGGFTDGCCRQVNTVQVFDPATNTWGAPGLAAPMPTARSGMGGSLGKDGLMYVIGGITFVPSFALLNVVEAYSTLGNKWVSRHPMPTARGGIAQAEAADGIIYVAGGQTQSSPDVLTNVVQAYDPAKDEWSSAAPMSNAREDFGMATGPDGRIYAFGGLNTKSVAISTAEAFTPPNSVGPGSEITAVLPDTGGNAGVVTVSIAGIGLSPGSGVKLVAAGQLDIDARSVTFLNSSYLTAVFDLTGATPGSYDAVVSPPTGPPINQSNAFSVVQGGAPDISVDVVGLPRLRAGAEQTYFVTVTNRGTLDASSARAWIAFPNYISWNTFSQPTSASGELDGYVFVAFDTAVTAGAETVIPIALTAPDQRAYAHHVFQIEAWEDAK